MGQFNTTISHTLEPIEVIKGHFYNVQLRWYSITAITSSCRCKWPPPLI